MKRSEDKLSAAPRGKPKSGRVWKDPGTKHRDTVAVPPLKQPWGKRRAQEAERKAVKEMEREMKAAKGREKEEARKRMEEKRERKLENERKGEIVQKITSAAKLKRLKKKQLRMIEKR